MADEFEQFLASALAPPDGPPDRNFVARVKAGIALEDRLAAQQRALVGSFIKQLIALFSIAAAVWVIGHSPRLIELFADAPGMMLVILLTSFACVVGLIGLRPGAETGSASAF